MRAFQKKNIASFSIFGLLIIVAVVAMGFVVVNYVTNDNSMVEVSLNDLIFDDNDRVIEITKNGSIKKKWDNNYYLIDEKNRSEKLGENPVIYDKNAGVLRMLGTTYRIYPDGTTLKKENETLVSNFNENSLYKLADRTYLMVGQEVYSYQPGFESSNFMKIKIDRNGNGLMQGVGLNRKSISSTVLVSGPLYFDVASELLYSDGTEVNLRKVIGSTNMYDGAPTLYAELGIERPETSTANTEIPDIEEYNITAGQGGQGGTGGLGGVGGFGGNAGNGGFGGNAGSGGQGGQGGTGGTGGNAPVIRDQDYYSININSLVSEVSSATINYTIYDPQNAYSDIYLKLSALNESTGAVEEQTYSLNKYDSTYKVFGLIPNKTYDVEISYRLYEIQDDKYVPGTENTLTKTYITTKSATANVNTEVVAKDNTNRATSVKCNINLQGYNLKTYEASINKCSYFEVYKYYSDGTIATETIRIRDAALQSGGQTFEIDVEDIISNNKQVTVKGIEIKEVVCFDSVVDSDTPFKIDINYYQAISNANYANLSFVTKTGNEATLNLKIDGYKLKTYSSTAAEYSTLTIIKEGENIATTREVVNISNDAYSSNGQKIVVDITDVDKIKATKIDGKSTIGDENSPISVEVDINFEYILNN